MLAFNFNYQVLSAIAGMTFWNFYFQLFPKSVRSPQVIAFLGHLKRYLRRPVLVIWDRLSSHKSLGFFRDFARKEWPLAGQHAQEVELPLRPSLLFSDLCR